MSSVPVATVNCITQIPKALPMFFPVIYVKCGQADDNKSVFIAGFLTLNVVNADIQYILCDLVYFVPEMNFD